MEEPWRVVHGTQISKPNHTSTELPLLLDAVEVTKKDFCISGLPVNLGEDDMEDILEEVCYLRSFEDPEEASKRIRFVYVHRRHEDDKRTWT